MTRPAEKTVLQAVSFMGFAACVLVALWGWQTGVLTSQERMQAVVSSFGPAGALLFVAFQAVQVVVPVLPGGLGCLAGVLLFGPLWGLVYNYTGIVIGSQAVLGPQLWKAAAVPAVLGKDHPAVRPLGGGEGPLRPAVRPGHLPAGGAG